MIYDFANIGKGIFCFLLIINLWTATFFAAGSAEKPDFKNNDKYLPQAKLGEYCWVESCQENQFCNDEFICQCRPGYKILNNDCVLISGENGTCITQDDCWGILVCINGICRKPIRSSDFVILAKICLVVTVIMIIAAVIRSLNKCLIKSNNSQAVNTPSNASCQDSAYASRNQVISPSLYEIQEDKPPSYEECIRSTERGTLIQPPLFVIYANSDKLTAENGPIIQPVNRTFVNTQNTTPLNAQSLSQE